MDAASTLGRSRVARARARGALMIKMEKSVGAPRAGGGGARSNACATKVYRVHDALSRNYSSCEGKLTSTDPLCTACVI